MKHEQEVRILLWLTACMAACTLGVAIFVAHQMQERGVFLRGMAETLERIEHVE